MSCLSDRGLCRSANAIHLPFGDQLGSAGAPFPIVIRCSLDPFARIIQRPLRGGPGVNAIHLPSGDHAGAEIRVVGLRPEDRRSPVPSGRMTKRASPLPPRANAISPLPYGPRDASIVAAALAACRGRKCEDEQGKGRHKHRSMRAISWFSPRAQMVSVEEQWGPSPAPCRP